MCFEVCIGMQYAYTIGMDANTNRKGAYDMKHNQLGYLGIDQYGTHYIIDKHPRKELLVKTGHKHTSKMYRDVKGGALHVGYIIADLWIEVFRVCQWKDAV